MATASMQNRGPLRPAQQPSSSAQPTSSASSRIKSPSSAGAPSTSPSPHHHHHHHHQRDTSNERQENKPTWGRKNSTTTTGSTGPATLINRTTTPSSSHSRTNSPTPTATPTAATTTTTTTNAWTQKADERAATQAHDQFTHLLVTLTSQTVILHTQTKGSFSGILTHFDLQPELKLVLSHVLPHPLPDPIPPPKNQFIVLPNEISSIQAAQISLSHHTPQTGPTTHSTFRTDTAISAQAPSTQRTLEKWQPDIAPTSGGMSGTLETKGGHWDQFATNERMFGVKSSYHEEIYTTKLDRSHPEFERKLKEADSIAREIEGKVSLNPHLAEERGQAVDDSGIDEEDKYAGVIRGSVSQPPSQAPALGYAAAAAGSLKYTPPGKRAAAAAGVAGDPSIISSKLRPTTDSEKLATEAKSALPLPPTATPSASSPISSTTPAPSNPNVTPQNPTPTPTPITSTTATNGTAITTTTTTTKDEPASVPPIVTPQIQDLGQKFLKEEKVKIKRARNLIGTKEKQRQFAEFAEFSNSLTLNMPVPKDLLPILAGKDPAKQKALEEKNQELKRRAEERAAAEKAKSTSGSPSTGVASAGTKSPVVEGPGGLAAGGLAERLIAIQNRGPGQIVSPVASPTPLEPGTVKPLVTNVVPTSGPPSAPHSAPKKLDPGAKEFVFKVTAKEFKPSSYATPLSTQSPSPSRSSVVSPTPGRGAGVEEKPGFFGNPKAANTTDTSKEKDSRPDFHKELGQTERVAIPMPYVTHPVWPSGESPEEVSAKGYMDIFTEGKSLPPTPTSGGQDDHSQSGHSYSRSSSVHPHHSTPHPPQPVQAAQPVVQGYPSGHPGLYPPVGAMPLPQYSYIVPSHQQIPLHPQQTAVAAPAAFTPQLIPGPFPGVTAQLAPQTAGPYGSQFQRQTTGGYQSVSPSPLIQSAIPAQFPPQQPFANGQFPGQGYPAGPAMYPAMPPYAFVPQAQGQQANGGFSGHPSPGRAHQAMVYQPMNMQPQMYPDMRHQFQPQSQMSLRTPPQPHIPPHQGPYHTSPSRNSYASAAGQHPPTPSHSRRQSAQPQPDDDPK